MSNLKKIPQSCHRCRGKKTLIWVIHNASHDQWVTEHTEHHSLLYMWLCSCRPIRVPLHSNHQPRQNVLLLWVIGMNHLFWVVTCVHWIILPTWLLKILQRRRVIDIHSLESLKVLQLIKIVDNFTCLLPIWYFNLCTLEAFWLGKLFSSDYSCSFSHVVNFICIGRIQKQSFNLNCFDCFYSY